MRDLLRGYYQPTTDEFSELWKNGTFVFDSSALLNLYRYPKDAKEDLLIVLNAISSRIWIPFQVALEFQENRLEVVSSQISKFAEIKKKINDTKNSFEQDFAELRKRHSSINPTRLQQELEGSFSSFLLELDALQNKQLTVDDDKTRDEIDALLEGKIGSPPSKADLEAIYSNGKTRYEQRIPPGYMDKEKGKTRENVKPNEKLVYSYGDLIFKPEYGDLLVWKQIIEEAKAQNWKYLIFVTDDRKEDWWWKFDSEGTKTIGPRPELIQEIYSEAQVTCFYMYNSERFLDFAKNHLGIDVKQESIDQVGDIVRTNIPKGLLFQKGNNIDQLVENATLEWLKETYTDSDFLKFSDSSSDFIRREKDEAQTVYQVIYSQQLSILRTRLAERIDRGAYEIAKGTVRQFVLVGILDISFRDKIDEISKRLSSLELPKDVSVIVGFLEIENEDNTENYKFVPLVYKNAGYLSDFQERIFRFGRGGFSEV